MSLASSACRRDAAGGDKGAEKKAPPHPHRLKLESPPELGQPLSLPGGARAVSDLLRLALAGILQPE